MIVTVFTVPKAFVSSRSAVLLYHDHGSKTTCYLEQQNWTSEDSCFLLQNEQMADLLLSCVKAEGVPPPVSLAVVPEANVHLRFAHPSKPVLDFPVLGELSARGWGQCPVLNQTDSKPLGTLILSARICDQELTLSTMDTNLPALTPCKLCLYNANGICVLKDWPLNSSSCVITKNDITDSWSELLTLSLALLFPSVWRLDAKVICSNLQTYAQAVFSKPVRCNLAVQWTDLQMPLNCFSCWYRLRQSYHRDEGMVLELYGEKKSDFDKACFSVEVLWNSDESKSEHLTWRYAQPLRLSQWMKVDHALLRFQLLLTPPDMLEVENESKDDEPKIAKEMEVLLHDAYFNELQTVPIKVLFGVKPKSRGLKVFKIRLEAEELVGEIVEVVLTVLNVQGEPEKFKRVVEVSGNPKHDYWIPYQGLTNQDLQFFQLETAYVSQLCLLDSAE